MNELSAGRRVSDERQTDPAGEFAYAADGVVPRNVPPVLVNYLRILKRWRWLLLGIVAVCLAIGLVLTLLTTPRYTASATLEIQRETANITNVEGVEPKSSAFDLEFYQTQYGLLKAESLAEKVVRTLKLQDDPVFFELYGAKTVADMLRERNPQAMTPTAREDRVRHAGKILLGSVAVVPTRQSRLVEVTFTSPDPAFAAKVTNAWTKAFIESNLERKFDATSYARTFLEDRLGQLRRQLEESERMLVGYATQRGIVSIPSSVASANGSTTEGTTAERPLVAENLAAINRELNEAIAARVAAESRLRSAGGDTAEALQSSAIQSLRQRRAELAAEYAKLLAQFQPEYPAVQNAAAELKQIDQSIAREEGRVGSTIRSAYQAAVARENALQAQVNGLRSEVIGLRNRSIQYNIYQREVDTNRQLYEGLLQRYKEIGITAGVGVNNVAVVDPAEVPQSPSSPNLMLNLLVALIAGMAIGGLAALGFDQIDETISDPADVQRLLGLPLLGAIPKVSGEDPRGDLDDPKSALVESYLSAQTSLAFTTSHGVPVSLMVTSTRPAEGKTTSSYALARSLARTGRKVILIDADMRSPSLHHIFQVTNAKGLSNYLAGEGDTTALYIDDKATGVAFMAAGPQPPNAAELLSGNRLPQLIEELTKTFDHVLLDVPPVMGMADAPLIANRVEGAVFVIESHETSAMAAQVALRRLEGSRGRLLGVLLTKFDSQRSHYGSGYGYYGYGYGDEERKG